MENEAPSAGGGRFELITGVLIAVFAACLAINDLASGHFGDDENQAITEKGNDYAWFQNKGIKQNLMKGQRDLMQELLETGVIPRDKAPALEASLKKMTEDIDRYGAEMSAIREGYAEATNSKAYAKLSEKRKADFDKEFAQVAGAKSRERKAEVLGNAGDRFDLATLFMQLSLVLGAISLVIGAAKVKRAFFYAMIGSGCVGVVYSAFALSMALPFL